MSIKNKLLIAMSTALIGLGLVVSGTFAYFSDTEETSNKIAAGTLDLGIYNTTGEEVLFEFNNKKPGDKFDYTFKIKNDGTLEIRDVKLLSSYTVEDKNGNKINNDFGGQILVKSLKVDDLEIVRANDELTLDDLRELILIEDFSVDQEADVYVNFEFKNEDNQNEYQGNSMELTWIFEAMQKEN